MSLRRVAALSTVVVPTAVVVALFLVSVTSHPGSGAGIAADQRPFSLPLIAAGGLVGWILATSAIFALFDDPTRLPPFLHGCAWTVIAGVRPTAAGGRARPAETPSDGYWRFIPTWQLLVLGLLGLPFLMWLSPLVLGWLLVPGVYNAVEAGGVLATGVILAGWTAWLVRRAWMP